MTLAVLLVVCCASPQTRPPVSEWPSASPESQGLDSNLLADGLEMLAQSGAEPHSATVIRNGVMVLDAVFAPFARGAKHDLASVTKSVTSLLIGIAIDRGLIGSSRVKVAELFADREIAALDARKRAMELRHLLSMTAGQRIVRRGEQTLHEMMATSDWVQFTLDLPMAHRPGTTYTYHSAGVHLLGAVVRVATGQRALEFARANLFEPLGITDVGWACDPRGDDAYGWGSLRLRPHDLAKLGYLVLHEGRWGAQRIVSPEWVRESTRRVVDFGAGRGYGYLWWLEPDAIVARGRGGQLLAIVVEHDLIAVFTGRNCGDVRFEWLRDYVLPAVRSDDELPAAPAAAERLARWLERVERSVAVAATPVPEPPAIAAEISGRRFEFEPNPVGMVDVEVEFRDRSSGVLKWTWTLDVESRTTVECPFGFDRPRRSRGRFEIPAQASARWVDDHTLALDIDEIGNLHRFDVRLRFDSDTELWCEAVERGGMGELRARARPRDGR